MTNTYRVRYKQGEFEIEVESSDQSYVDAKVRELLGGKPEITVREPSKRTRTAKPAKPPRARVDRSAPDGNDDVADTDIAAIVASIHEAPNFDKIDRNVLKQRGELGRILMCFYFAYKYAENLLLSTGHVERITDQLRVKIASTNVARKIREGASQYLTADGVRKKGVPTYYKINRRGIETFERIMRREEQ